MILAVFGLYQWYSNSGDSQGKYLTEHHDEIIMYSLTTCGYCKAKAEELRSNHISFTEYFLDKDPLRGDELNIKLIQAGLPKKVYGTPIFDAYGYMLPNNPPLSKILALQYEE